MITVRLLPHMIARAGYGALATLALLAGCASLGLAPAQTFDGRWAYAMSTYTAVVETAATAVNSGELSSQDGKTLLELANNTRTLLDTAKTVAATGDIQTAEGRLSLAVSVLSELQSYLRAKGALPQ